MPYQPLHAQTRWVTRGLATVALLTAVVVLHDAYDIWLIGEAIRDPAGRQDALESSDSIGRNLTWLVLLATLGTAILWLVWHHQATKNLQAFRGPYPVRYSPTWAVWQWFVPFVSLVLPKAATNDLWRAREGDLRIPLVFQAWWATWVVSWVMNRVVSNAYGKAEDLEAYRAADRLDIVAGAITIASAFFAWRVLLAITERHDERAARLASEPLPPTGPPHISGDEEFTIAPAWGRAPTS